MNPLADVFDYVTTNPISSAIIALVALAGLALTVKVLRLAWRAAAWLLARYVAPRPVEDVLTVVSASIATGVSAQGMWRFSGDVLGFDGPLRVLLFAFIEVAMVTSAVRARRNMRENHKAGIDGLAVWALTCLSAVLSSMDSSSFPEAVFRLAAPIVAAWLWERGMSIERQRLTGRSRINWRLTPERVLVRIGLAESSDRTATEVDVHRRLTRVALTAKRARALREADASDCKQARALAALDKAMDRAVEHTGLVQDKDKQERLLNQIAALYNTAELTKVKTPAFWQESRGTGRDTTERPAIPPAADASSVAGAYRDTPRDTDGGTSGDTAPAVSPPSVAHPPVAQQPVSPPPVTQKPVTQKPVSRKPNSTRHGTPGQPSSEELARRIKWLHDLVKTHPGLEVADLRDKAIEEYGVSTRTAYRYIEQAGLAPNDTTGGTPRDTTGGADGGTPRDTDGATDDTDDAASDTPGDTARDTTDGTTRDTPGDTAPGTAPNAA
ncbi:hypothetical protein [Nonomuraea rhizosphaerae]|uniref:hypothetical protein n=1 Tax=Nonomuraea rhizosphaerae TaxID=2665663 RepID=UPI001C5D2924|nr:hypothetical protein [Nonomuraea rhizosphaerae]